MEPIEFRFEDVRHASAGSIVYPIGGRYGPRRQHDVQLVMLYTGEMNVAIDGRSLRVPPGHVALLKPGHEEAFAFSKSEQTWHRWIAVHVSPLRSDALEALRRLPEYLPLSEEMNRLADLMLNLQRHAPRDDPAIRSLGLAALHLYPAESARMSQMLEKHPAVHVAAAWLREHFAEDVSLADVAAHAGLSAEHLVRLFKRDEHTTPIAYLWDFRIGQAVQLLANTGLTVTEIALRCGFKTSHHFARLLKRKTGRTARELRQQSWGGMRQA